MTAFFNTRRQALETYVTAERAALAQAETDLMATLGKAPPPEKPGPPTPAPPSNLLTTEEVAARIGYHPESVRRCIRQGRIKPIRFGRSWRIPSSELARILSAGLPV